MKNPINLDPTEVAKFDIIADQWWDIDGELKTLHQINPVRLAFIQKYLTQKNLEKNPGKPLKILDVGCGGGILTESLAREGALMTGIDASTAAIAAAEQHAEAMGLSISYEQTAVEDLAEKYPHTFDAVTCMELLEHVPNPAAIIASCATLLKPGGLVFFSTINRTLKAYGLAILAAEYVLKLLPKGTHQYEKFIQPAELDNWARAAELERVALAGIQYNPLSKHAKLCTDVAVNFLACYELS